MESDYFIARGDLIFRIASDQFEKEFLTNLGLDPESCENTAYAFRVLGILLNMIDAKIPHYEFVRKGPEENG